MLFIYFDTFMLYPQAQLWILASMLVLTQFPPRVFLDSLVFLVFELLKLTVRVSFRGSLTWLWIFAIY